MGSHLGARRGIVSTKRSAKVGAERERAFQTEGTAGAKALRWVQCLVCLKNGKMAIVARGEKRSRNARE